MEGAKYPWGDDRPVCTPGAENGAQYGGCSGRTVPVMTFSPNSYGLYDMIGNVWEWVLDWYDSDYFSSSPASNPQGPPSGSAHVLRGGSWLMTGLLRSTSRDASNPISAGNDFGFRCALTP